MKNNDPITTAAKQILNSLDSLPPEFREFAKHIAQSGSPDSIENQLRQLMPIATPDAISATAKAIAPTIAQINQITVNRNDLNSIQQLQNTLQKTADKDLCRKCKGYGVFHARGGDGEYEEDYCDCPAGKEAFHKDHEKTKAKLHQKSSRLAQELNPEEMPEDEELLVKNPTTPQPNVPEIKNENNEPESSLSDHVKHLEELVKMMEDEPDQELATAAANLAKRILQELENSNPQEIEESLSPEVDPGGLQDQVVDEAMSQEIEPSISPEIAAAVKSIIVTAQVLDSQGFTEIAKDLDCAVVEVLF